MTVCEHPKTGDVFTLTQYRSLPMFTPGMFAVMPDGSQTMRVVRGPRISLKTHVAPCGSFHSNGAVPRAAWAPRAAPIANKATEATAMV